MRIQDPRYWFFIIRILIIDKTIVIGLWSVNIKTIL